MFAPLSSSGRPPARALLPPAWAIPPLGRALLPLGPWSPAVRRARSWGCPVRRPVRPAGGGRRPSGPARCCPPFRRFPFPLVLAFLSASLAGFSRPVSLPFGKATARLRTPPLPKRPHELAEDCERPFLAELTRAQRHYWSVAPSAARRSCRRRQGRARSQLRRRQSRSRPEVVVEIGVRGNAPLTTDCRNRVENLEGEAPKDLPFVLVTTRLRSSQSPVHM